MTKTITFIEETCLDGTRYSTEVNGVFISGSLSYDKRTAESHYDYIVAQAGVTGVKKTLRETTIKGAEATAGAGS